MDYAVSPGSYTAEMLTITYTIPPATNGGVPVTDPDGNNAPIAVFDALPVECDADTSSIKINADGSQTMVCNQLNVDGGTIYSQFPTARATAYAPNGSTFAIDIELVATDGDNPDIVQTAQTDTFTISAAPRWDFVSGRPFAATAAVVDGALGYVVGTSWGIVGDLQGSGKGSEYLAPNPTYTFDVSYDNSTGPKTWQSRAHLEGPDTGCVESYDSLFFPHSSLDFSQFSVAENSVTDSGTRTCVQAAPGSPLNVTIGGLDTSGRASPTTTGHNLYRPIPANEFYVGAYTHHFFIPNDDILASESCTDGDDLTECDLDLTYTVSNFDPVGISGESNYGAGTEPEPDAHEEFGKSNRLVSRLVPIGSGGTSVGKSFGGSGDGGPLRAIDGSATDLLSPGGLVWGSVHVGNGSADYIKNNIVCDIFDNNTLTIATRDSLWKHRLFNMHQIA